MLAEPKYKYVYDVWTNNLCHGYMFIKRFPTLTEARTALYQIRLKYGVCEIVRKRYYY